MSLGIACAVIIVIVAIFMLNTRIIVAITSTSGITRAVFFMSLGIACAVITVIVAIFMLNTRRMITRRSVCPKFCSF